MNKCHVLGVSFTLNLKLDEVDQDLSGSVLRTSKDEVPQPLWTDSSRPRPPF